jgi:uncharacterized membrane protein YesL
VVFLRLVGRGLKDVFDQLLTLSAMSLLLWASLVTIVGFPPMLLSLFGMADPRRQVMSPEFRDVVPMFRRGFGRAWAVFVVTMPLIVILVWNTSFFGGSGEAFQVMVPLWMLMTIIMFILMLFAFSVAATMETGVRGALRGAIFVLVQNPFRGLALSVFLILLGIVMTISVVPMLFLGPGIIASIVNRFVLWGLQVDVIDPNSPTDERAFERQRGINPEQNVVERLRGSFRR